MKYSVCIDGGGTKTSFVLYDPKGNEIASSQDSTIHLLHVDYNEAYKIVKDNVLLVCKAAGISIHDVVISGGLAGFGSNAVIKERFSMLFKDIFPDVETYLTSDGHTALLGTLNGKDGILIIAGTGSIAYRLKNGIVQRSGGWGYLLGDEGSAYDIAKKLLATYCKQSDGRIPKTELHTIVKESLNLNEDFDLVKYIYTTLQGSRDKIAKISKIAYQCALRKDPYAIQIFDDAAKELAEHICALSKDEESVQVSYVGGVFHAQEYILEPLKKYIGKRKIVEPIHSPEFGAYLFYKSQISK